jgi:hypothetical protein
MAELSITATDVKLTDANARHDYVKAGEAVTAGETGYGPVDGEYFLADSSTDGKEAPSVLFLQSVSAGEYVLVALPNSTVVVGNVLTQSVPYFQSATPGKIEELSDIASGEKTTLVGFGKSATELVFRPSASDIAKA